MVDGLADGPELRRGQHLALHQPSGGLVVIGQGVFDAGPIDVGHLRQHLAAHVGLQVVDHVGGVVGIHLADRRGQHAGRHVLEDVFAQRPVELRQHLGQHVGREQRHQGLAVVAGEEAHQVGDVRRMQGVHQLAEPLGIGSLGGVHHHFDEGGVQRIVVAERQVFEIFGRGRDLEVVVSSRHLKTSPFSPPRRALLTQISLVRSRRLELPRVAPQRPQRCASTNSATTATSEAGGLANALRFGKQRPECPRLSAAGRGRRRGRAGVIIPRRANSRVRGPSRIDPARPATAHQDRMPGSYA